MKVFGSDSNYITITGEVTMEGIAEFTQAVQHAVFVDRTMPHHARFELVVVSVFDLKFNTKDSAGVLKRTLNDAIKKLSKQVNLRFDTIAGKNHDFNFYTGMTSLPPDEE